MYFCKESLQKLMKLVNFYKFEKWLYFILILKQF